MATTSPDSGSFTDHYDIIDTADDIKKEPSKIQSRKIRRRVPSSSRTRNGHSFSGGSAPIFSASPMEPSPISLMGGFMGIACQTTMNEIKEDQDNFVSVEVHEQTPLLGGKSTS